jgi:poly-gamma-glutamate synthesis protein (capsule biosynthesis protein)
VKYLLIIGALLVILVALAPVTLDTLEPERAPVPSASIIFGGDLMFDRYIRQVSDVVGGDYPFSCIDGVLQDADLVVANLEGPITDNPSRSIGTASGAADNYVFTFPPATAALLARHNIKIVNLGNNHILNFGTAGIASTKRYLDAAEVQWFGDSSVATTTLNGIPLAFVNYNQFSSDQVPAFPAGYITIVYTHWGEEYEPATDKEKELAHRLIDGGAEIVIGSHPHVVQEHELYAGKHIYYSLGNFIFDQYFSDAVMHGLLIKVQFSPAGVIGVTEIPIVLTTDGRVCHI